MRKEISGCKADSEDSPLLKKCIMLLVIHSVLFPEKHKCNNESEFH